MGIAEDLKALEDLHQKGKLTDQEFSDSKAAALQKSSQTPVSVPKRLMHPVVKALLVVLLVYIGLLWHTNGTRKTSQILAILAEFHGDKAKLIWPVSLDRKKMQSETYKVLAILDKPKVDQN
jgi:hypothetical protein